jgi:hypothetical protein
MIVTDFVLYFMIDPTSENKKSKLNSKYCNVSFVLLGKYYEIRYLQNPVEIQRKCV